MCSPETLEKFHKFLNTEEATQICSQFHTDIWQSGCQVMWYEEYKPGYWKRVPIQDYPLGLHVSSKFSSEGESINNLVMIAVEVQKLPRVRSGDRLSYQFY
ncbi:hypothetical protein BO86DRAFT_250198 [Aspergillus japonicus CBS 114.51]|uniref:Uncharacterized protein n=1 Tax=Aspergillus japonicus CBS 114.51 TaxID=1448312 RepID=A0A8T8WLE5_ASPJA|nr:hypothetical protein BO86DRAFT_250198 [Aspergillus japonicus CBS 114.51]RAH76472.1 hypothetical protein BO86DRAFT_250198 [Aspergillus japonicus CBS 114.51]